jgi:hypothetical protein
MRAANTGAPPVSVRMLKPTGFPLLALGALLGRLGVAAHRLEALDEGHAAALVLDRELARAAGGEGLDVAVDEVGEVAEVDLEAVGLVVEIEGLLEAVGVDRRELPAEELSTCGAFSKLVVSRVTSSAAPLAGSVVISLLRSAIFSEMPLRISETLVTSAYMTSPLALPWSRSAPLEVIWLPR